MKNAFISLMLLAATTLATIAQTANQFEFRKYNSGGGMTSFWITPENSKAFGLDGSGVPAMLSVGGSATLAGLSDVAISGLANLDLLRYNSAAGKWVNIPDSIYAAASHTQAWSTITSTPTTVSGFGITDAFAGGAANDAKSIWYDGTTTNGTIIFEGLTANSHEVNLSLSGDPAADTNLFLPTGNTGGTLMVNFASPEEARAIWGANSGLKFEGGTADDFEITLAPAAATSDTTVLIPNTAGTLITTGDTGTVTNTMLAGSIDPSKVTGTAVVGAVGTTDNAIVRADGTGGSTAQGSAATITDAGAPTFYDKVTLAKTGTTTTGGFEVFADPLNPGNDSLYILPPSTSNRIYIGKTGQLVGAINYQGASNENFGNIISTAGHYQIIEYGGTGISLLPFNGPVNLSPAVASGVKVVASYVELDEMTAPSAPGANKARLYLEDNGSGKGRLMVLFPTGAAQQAAIEP